MLLTNAGKLFPVLKGPLPETTLLVHVQMSLNSGSSKSYLKVYGQSFKRTFVPPWSLQEWTQITGERKSGWTNVRDSYLKCKAPIVTTRPFSCLRIFFQKWSRRSDWHSTFYILVQTTSFLVCINYVLRSRYQKLGTLPSFLSNISHCHLNHKITRLRTDNIRLL